MQSAALVLATGQRILLLAKSPVALGRETTNAIVLRLWPRTSKAHETLTCLISRQQLEITLEADGLHVADKPKYGGTFLQSRPLPKPYLIPTALPRSSRHLLAVGGILGLQLTCYRDPGWDRFSEEHYHRLLGPADPLWNAARGSRIDAVRLSRSPTLLICDHIEQLKERLGTQLKDVEQAAQHIDLADGLADASSTSSSSAQPRLARPRLTTLSACRKAAWAMARRGFSALGEHSGWKRWLTAEEFVLRTGQWRPMNWFRLRRA